MRANRLEEIILLYEQQLRIGFLRRVAEAKRSQQWRAASPNQAPSKSKSFYILAKILQELNITDASLN